jgi:tRNA A-37 threonylcarbamoyl transferase component Bud32/TolB-like protein
MAHVFLANDVTLSRRVVVKLLPDSLVGSVNVERFTREVQVAAQLQHPCVVPVLSAGVADGLPYYTMPFVEGKSLRDRLSEGGELSIPEALKALRDLASGLAYAHEHGIVHRDIKPENILLSDGYALLTDFGIAKALSTSTSERLTATGIAIGTPNYMSPEQASGDPLVDHRADIYAFGCVAFEMLVGRPPFSGRSFQAVTAAHLVETPSAVVEHRPSVPAALSRLVARCLEKRPADRPQSARELVQELDAIGTPAGGKKAAAVDAGGKRRTLATIVSGLVALFIVAGIGVAIARRGAATAATARAHRVVVRTFKNNSGDASLDPIGSMAADWIARGLTETPSVDVAGTESDIARDPTSANAKTLDATSLGRLVRARYVISGSYYTQGDSLYLQADVTDADAGRRVLSVAPVGQTIASKQGALERLRQRVAGALVPFFDSSIVAMAHVPPKYEAYEEFLIGNQLFTGDPAASLTHLRAAVRLDSSFVYARLRLISQLEVTSNFAARDSAIAGLAAMRNALNPFEAAAFDLRVAIARRDYHAAYLAGLAERRLAPTSTWASYEGAEAALLDGRVRETIRLLEVLDPESGALRSSPNYYTFLFRSYHALNELNDVRRWAERGRRQYPAAAFGRFARVFGMEGDARAVERMLDSAISAGALLNGEKDRMPAGPGAAISALYELDAHGHAAEARDIARRALSATQVLSAGGTASNAVLMARLNLLGYLDHWREAASVADTLLARRPTSFVTSIRGVASAMLGDTSDARQRADAVAPDSTGYRSPRHRARILAALGDKGGALELLRLIDSPASQWLYHDDFIYRFMHGYAPFDEFLKPRD